MKAIPLPKLAAEISRRRNRAEAAIQKVWRRSMPDYPSEAYDIIWDNEVGEVFIACKCQEELIEALEDIYIDEWNDCVSFNVPQADPIIPESTGIFISKFLAFNTESLEFFAELNSEDSDTDGELPSDPNDCPSIQDWLECPVRVLRFFRDNLESLHQIPPVEFEQFTAMLLRSLGYEVTRTPATRDGGYDIIAVWDDLFGNATTLVECKRYAPNRPVSVAALRGLLGAVSQQNADRGLIITTSRFTRDALTFQAGIPLRIILMDVHKLQCALDRHLALREQPLASVGSVGRDAE